MEKTTVLKAISSDYTRANTITGPNFKYPYGTINFPTRQKQLPTGIFVIATELDIFPSLHGITGEELLKLKRLCITDSCSAYMTSVHYLETAEEVYLVNTGSENLRMGDQFYVTAPDATDAAAQRDFSRGTYASTFGPEFDNIAHEIWGGVLATRPLNTSSVIQDFTRRLQDMPEAGGLAEILSPATASGMFGIMRLIAAAGVSGHFPANSITTAMDGITGAANVAPATVSAMLTNQNIQYYVSEVLKALGEIVGVMYGYGAGIVSRPSTGHTTDIIAPGEGFWAKITRLNQV